MSFSFTGLPTWMTLPLDPDGLHGSLAPRVIAGLGSAVLTVGGTAVLVSGGSAPVGVALALAGFLVAVAWALVRRPQWLLARYLLLRVWLLLAASALYAARRPNEVALIWVTAGFLALVITGEPVLRVVVNVPRTFVANLPGIGAVPPPPVPLATIPLAVLAATLAGGVLAGLRGSAWIWIGLVVLVGAFAGVVALSAARQTLLDKRRRSMLRRAVQAYAPEFVVYTAFPEDASYQVTMWLPYLERIGRPFVIITRSELPATALAELTNAPVLCCLTIAEVETVLVPSITTVFYVNASSGNGHMVRHSHLSHVFLGHGDSDKATSSNPIHAMYDGLLVAGEAAIDRYPAHGVHIPRERFTIVGRPQVEGVTRTDRPISAIEDQTVLYAPTWRGAVEETALYSLPHGPQIVRALLARGVRVVFRPHPFTQRVPEDAALLAEIGAILAEDSTRTGRQHIWGEPAERAMSIIDCFNISDAMVSDVSSVVSDYLYSGKPFAIYAPGPSLSEFVEQFPVARAGYQLTGDVSNLEDVLDRTLASDPDRAERLMLREAYLGDFPAESYSDAFVDEARSWVTGTRHGATGRQDADDQGEDEDEQSSGPEHSRADGPGGGDGGAEGESEHEAPRKSGASSTGKASGAGSAGRGKLFVSGSLALLDGTSALTAAGTALCAMTSAPVAVVLALAVLTIGWMCLVRPPWLQRSTSMMLAAFPVQRSLLIVSVAGLLMRHDGMSRAWVAVLVVLTGLMPFIEMWARSLLAVSRLRVVNLPTLDYVTSPAAGHQLVYGASISLLVVELALAAAGWVYPLVVVAAALLAYLVVLFVGDLRLLLASEQATARLGPALSEYGPQFAVYFASDAEASYQLAMWMPFFERIGRRFIVITRTLATVPMIQELTDAPILFCRTLRSLDVTITPGLTTVFYVNNGLKNTHYIEHRELEHIWLNHGDSEKPACFNPVHAIYDRIFAAGQAGIDRYARHGVNISPEKFEIVGRPQVETIEVAGARAADGPASEAAPTVLYAPTWVGPFADSNVYSLPVGTQIVSALLAHGCTVIFRAHPLNYRTPVGAGYIREVSELLAADKKATGRQHIWGPDAEQAMSLEECFNLSAAMVADVSAVLSDYLYSEKPFSIMAMGGNGEQLVADAPIAAAAYVIHADLANIGEVLEDMLGADPLLERRRVTKTYYLGDAVADAYAEGFLGAARRHIDRQGRAGASLVSQT